MTNLLTRLREAADEMQRGVHSPGHVAAIMEAIKELERRRGRWEEKYVENTNPLFHRRFYCSACGDWQTYGETDFCPECGADMRQEET